MELDHILITGAREHNLKNVDVRIPKKKLVVFTGVSGSGKSSLAFDTLYAEGQRRYVESLSAYARQFLGQMDKPRYDTMRGLGPTISIEQKTVGNNPRSTVGTITEISDYLRVLFARVGRQHCPSCGEPVSGQSAEQIVLELLKLPRDARLWLLAPLLVHRKGEHRELLAEARASGIVRLRVDGKVVRTDQVEALDKRRKHHVEAVIDRVIIGQVDAARLTDSVEQALKRGKGQLIAWDESSDRLYSERLACERCGLSLPELSPQSFSFNSPQGMCNACNGLGSRLQVDLNLVVPDATLSLDQGAIVPWGEDVSEKSSWDFRSQILERLKIDGSRPFNKLTAKQRQALLYGTGDRKYTVEWNGKHSAGTFQVTWEGVVERLMRRLRQTQSERTRNWCAQFMSEARCSECHGSRLRPESRSVLIEGRSIAEVSAMTVEQASRSFEDLKLDGARATIAGEVVKELAQRLSFLRSVGLGYLSLDRAGPTLSGGEAQRIRLASQVGSELTGVVYVLDEPSIGLHQRDNRRLLETLLRMRDIGNTVVCVEHDEETIRAADHVIDFGPGAGARGGEILFSGSPKQLERCKASLTGSYLSGRRRIEPRARRHPTGELGIEGASKNNLKDLDVGIPLGVLVAVTGVSGAGKSTLINDVVTPALQHALHQTRAARDGYRSLRGIEGLQRVIDIDQRPIGRTPRSNPATYIKVFDAVRTLFSQLPEARARGYSAGRFSFNVKGGRCEACEGDGVRKIEMHFLADVYVECEQCRGRRYNSATLDITYRGRSIAEVLQTTVAEALELFAAHPAITGPLSLLSEVGLDYLQLGQPSPTLSGGEAQRIKLARELSKRDNGRTFYVLDEPTTGLHFDDVRKLLEVLHRLVDAGNTVVVIEHNLDVIRCADYVIDLGPEGGPGGGRVVAHGTPEQVAQSGSHTGRYLARALKSGAGPSAAPTRRRAARSAAPGVA